MPVWVWFLGLLSDKKSLKQLCSQDLCSHVGAEGGHKVIHSFNTILIERLLWVVGQGTTMDKSGVCPDFLESQSRGSPQLHRGMAAPWAVKTVFR